MNPHLERMAEARRRGEGVSRLPITPPTDARPARPPLTLLTSQAKVDVQARLDSLRTELTLVKDRTLGDFTREDGKEVGKIQEEIARVADSISVGSEPRPLFLGENRPNQFSTSGTIIKLLPGERNS